MPFDNLDVLWAQTNYEKVKDDGNADRELARFELVEMFIRLSYEHFVTDDIKHRASKVCTVHMVIMF